VPRLGRLALVACLALASCRAAPASTTDAGPAPAAFVRDEAPVSLPAHVIPLPVVRQETNYSCGDGVALSLLRYYAPDPFSRTPESALYAPLHTTPQDGTEPQAIADYLNRQPGIAAEVRDGSDGGHVELDDLEHAVDRGDPTIVALQAWQSVATYAQMKPWSTDWDDGHYAIVLGYDAKNLFFMDPSTSGHYTYVPIEQFLARWHDVLGTAEVHTQHIAVFVHGSRAVPAPPAAPTATLIN